MTAIEEGMHSKCSHRNLAEALLKATHTLSFLENESHMTSPEARTILCEAAKAIGHLWSRVNEASEPVTPSNGQKSARQ